MTRKMPGVSLRSHHGQPRKIGDIARSALILTHFEHGYIT